MKTLLIVYHSVTGGTEQMARAAARAAEREPEIAVCLSAAPATGPEALLHAEGYLFACPENVAVMSGLMKDFFDRSYYPALDRIQGRPYAALICAGSDGTNAAPPDRAHCHRLATAHDLLHSSCARMRRRPRKLDDPSRSLRRTSRSAKRSAPPLP